MFQHLRSSHSKISPMELAGVEESEVKKEEVIGEAEIPRAKSSDDNTSSTIFPCELCQYR